jgi:hypothetical protein
VRNQTEGATVGISTKLVSAFGDAESHLEGNSVPANAFGKGFSPDD